MLLKPTTPTIAMLRRTDRDARTRIAGDWCCPHCFRPLRPSAVRCDTDGVHLICQRCHTELLAVEPIAADQ